jgi:hypothetical protein
MCLGHGALGKHKDVRGLERVFCSVGGGVNGESAGLEGDVINVVEATEVNVVGCCITLRCCTTAVLEAGCGFAVLMADAVVVFEQALGPLEPRPCS